MDNFTAIDFINLLGLNLPGKARHAWFVGDWGWEYLELNWWTVGVEFVFYLIFPLIFSIYRKLGIIFLFKLLFIIVTFKIFLFYSLLQEYGFKKLEICLKYSFFGNFDIFIIGMIAAYYQKQVQNNIIITILKSKAFLILYIALMWSILIHHVNNIPIPCQACVLAILCAGLIVLYQRSLSNTQESFVSKILATLGSMSFSIYLLHSFVKTGLQGLGVDQWFIDTFLTSLIHDQEAIKFSLLTLYIPIILIISKITFDTIEKPFLSMRIKYFARNDE
jgi:peptidoglycan/LPS O-acetylase OafA/YrhL